MAQTVINKKDLIGNWKPLKYEVTDVAIVERDTILLANDTRNLPEDAKQTIKEAFKKESVKVFNSSLSLKEDNSFLVVMFNDGKKKEIVGTYEIEKNSNELRTVDSKGKKEVFNIVSFESKRLLVLSQKNREGMEIVLTYQISN